MFVQSRVVEQRVTEYSKGATGGNWNDVGRLRQAPEGQAGPAANEDLSEAGGDMFSRAGVAAEKLNIGLSI